MSHLHGNVLHESTTAVDQVEPRKQLLEADAYTCCAVHEGSLAI